MPQKKMMTSQQKIAARPRKERRTLENKIRRIYRSSGYAAAETYAAKNGMIDYLKRITNAIGS